MMNKKRVFCRTCGKMNSIPKHAKRFVCEKCKEEFSYSKALSYKDKLQGVNTVQEASIYKWCLVRTGRNGRRRAFTYGVVVHR